MSKILKYISLVAHLAGALGRFSSTYRCEDINDTVTLMQPIEILDQIAGTWYEVERLEEYQTECNYPTQQKYVFSNDTVTVKEETITQNTTSGRNETNNDLPLWIVKTGEDFTKHAIKLSCENEPLASTGMNQSTKSDLWIGMLSRNKYLTHEEKKIFEEKLKTIADLAAAELKNICFPPICSTSDGVQYRSIAGDFLGISSATAFTVSTILLVTASAVALREYDLLT